MTSTIFFSNSRSLEQPGLIIESLEYKHVLPVFIQKFSDCFFGFFVKICGEQLVYSEFFLIDSFGVFVKICGEHIDCRIKEDKLVLPA